MIEIKEKKKRKKKTNKKMSLHFTQSWVYWQHFVFVCFFFLNSDFRVFIIFGVF